MQDKKPEKDQKKLNNGDNNGKRIKSFLILILWCVVGALIGLALRGGA